MSLEVFGRNWSILEVSTWIPLEGSMVMTGYVRLSKRTVESVLG
jgi:hypothetical protein